MIGAALSRWGHFAAPPAPEDLATNQTMAANLSALLIEECGLHSPGSSAYDLLQRAAAMLVDYGLPARSTTLPAPGPGEVGELVARLRNRDRWTQLTDAQVDRAATLLQQQSAPAPAVVPVAVSERLPGKGDCDEDGFCWMGYGYRLPGENEKDQYAIWMLMPLEESNGEVWVRACDIPLPQAGEAGA